MVPSVPRDATIAGNLKARFLPRALKSSRSIARSLIAVRSSVVRSPSCSSSSSEPFFRRTSVSAILSALPSRSPAAWKPLAKRSRKATSFGKSGRRAWPNPRPVRELIGRPSGYSISLTQASSPCSKEASTEALGKEENCASISPPRLSWPESSRVPLMMVEALIRSVSCRSSSPNASRVMARMA